MRSAEPLLRTATGALGLRLVALVLAASIPALGRAQEPEPAAVPAAAVNDVCPVMPEEGVLDDMDVFVEYEGLSVALCCKRCKKEWLKDPEPYVAWLRGNGYLAAEPLAGETEEAPETSAPAEFAAAAAVPGPAAQAARPPGTWLEAALDRVGRFHTLVVHFPIALLLAALLAQALGAWRGRERYEAAGRFCLAFGAVGAIVAALLGWASAASGSYPSAAQQDLFLHRWIGTATAAAAALAWCTLGRASSLHRALLTLAALGVACAGYFGANLIYGPGHLFGP